jgi:hypothetical protein
MTEACELFSSLTERVSYVHVHLSDDVKYALKGERIVTFQLESKVLLDAYDVLYVLGLKKNFLRSQLWRIRVFPLLFREGRYSYIQRKISWTTKCSLGLEKALYTGYRESMFRNWYMTMTIYVSCGTRGWDTYTIGLC